jgi:hypothetical protein
VRRIPSADFYSRIDEAPQQGDILFGAVSRVVGEDRFSPARWLTLDEHEVVLRPETTVGLLRVPALRVMAGRALVMICSHDCGLDKEFNASVDRMIDDSVGGSLDEATAIRVAEDWVDLDRSFSVSPLVDPDTVEVAGAQVDRGLLMSGRVVGYVPVPELVIADRVVIPESVVDLGYRSTLDRLAYVQRITCVSELAREHLRFALARLDVLRTHSLEDQLSGAVGQLISSAKVSKTNPLVVEIRLADGSTIELLAEPASPGPGPASRTRRSVRGPSGQD